MTNVAVVVLAAGASTRMGEPKPLLEIEGRTYLETLLGSIRATGARPLVVLGAGAATIRERVVLDDKDVVINPDWRAGMLGSVQTAVRHLLDDATVDALALVPVDQPRISATTMKRLIDAWNARPAPVAVAAYRGRRGHPALFARATWHELLAASPDEGARSVVATHSEQRLIVEVDDPWVVVDADTPADHAAMREGRLRD